MENRKKPLQRHFAYQHPTFGTKNRPKPESAWKKSVYYWWWAYLKRNQDYLKCCENKGVGKLANLYKDFGDVRGDNFKEWWGSNTRGVDLFAEPSAEDSIRVLHQGENVLSSDEALTVSFPINLPKRFLEKRFRELLVELHPGKPGRQLAKKSKAKYKVRGQLNIYSLKLALEVYDFKVANPKLKLWEIGNAIPKFYLEQKIKSLDTPSTLVDKKIKLAVSVSRSLKRVKDSIKATSEGSFP